MMLEPEKGHEVDAAMSEVQLILHRNTALFASVETVMANHRVSHVCIGGLRIERLGASREGGGK